MSNVFNNLGKRLESEGKSKKLIDEYINSEEFRLIFRDIVVDEFNKYYRSVVKDGMICAQSDVSVDDCFYVKFLQEFTNTFGDKGVCYSPLYVFEYFTRYTIDELQLVLVDLKNKSCLKYVDSSTLVFLFDYLKNYIAMHSTLKEYLSNE